jgi:hypothetical protein
MWEQIQTWVQNKFLKIEFQINKEIENIPEEYILKELSQKLADDIIENKYYILEKDEKPYDPHSPFSDRIISYQMYVALDPKINQNMLRMEKVFRINDVNFSEDEIRKALIKTYPQKLI